jgi:hypothetical protein
VVREAASVVRGSTRSRGRYREAGEEKEDLRWTEVHIYRHHTYNTSLDPKHSLLRTGYQRKEPFTIWDLVLDEDEVSVR